MNVFNKFIFLKFQNRNYFLESRLNIHNIYLRDDRGIIVSTIVDSWELRHARAHAIMTQLSAYSGRGSQQYVFITGTMLLQHGDGVLITSDDVFFRGVLFATNSFYKYSFSLCF